LVHTLCVVQLIHSSGATFPLHLRDCWIMEKE